MTAVSTVDGLARSAREVLGGTRDIVEPALRAAVDTLPASMREVVGYHLGWWDEDGRPAHADGGKALRPALALLCAQAMGGTAADAVPAAVAVELVHNFSLLHDDVMDGDATRRHRQTAWRVYGVGPAILAGDSLLVLATEVLSDSGHARARELTRTLTAAVLDLLHGQRADLSFESRTDVSLPECLRMAEAKTGALLACACGLGAAFGGAQGEPVEHLGAFGRYLGLAFQFVDDLLGIWGDPDVTGKPVHSDLRSRKKSLPVVAALTTPGADAARELAALYAGADALSDAELSRAAALIEATGARAWSQEQADQLLARAIGRLRAAGTTPVAAAELTGLAMLATHRDH